MGGRGRLGGAKATGIRAASFWMDAVTRENRSRHLAKKSCCVLPAQPPALRNPSCRWSMSLHSRATAAAIAGEFTAFVKVSRKIAVKTR